MAKFIPITLVGDNLGERHRHLNSLVTEAGPNIIQDINNVKEQGPLDRIFKIDVASKAKDVKFIIKNLKDDDLLYVSRALKATWLLDDEHRDVINPNYLEHMLYPEMLTTAVTRMKHWLYINLRDRKRCQEFYEYYKGTQFHFAIKFLSRCNSQYLLEEFPKILIKITPHYLKIFSEKCPKLAKIYFDALITDGDVSSIYLNDEVPYIESIKCVLKSDPDLYLDIIEKYFNKDKAKTLSPAATKYVLSNHKHRYLAKPELYASWLLHLPTLAKLLNEKECEELVLKLARAKYVSSWFSYKAVEPLIKRIKPECRAAFKKRVFVEKNIGQLVEQWPYTIPAPPTYQGPTKHVFDDMEYDPKEFEYSLKRKIKKKRGGREEYCEIYSEARREKNELERIFDEYRFCGFDRTFYELSQRLRATCSAESRRNIFMVLISKTGGRIECIETLLQLLARCINEPANIRSAIVRSLVKRALVWRLPNDSWILLLKFGHHLGLDGADAEDNCTEGLHAFVLRELLSQNDLGSTLREAFMRDFSTLREYSTNVHERKLVVAGLIRTLLTAAETSEPQTAVQHFLNLFDVYQQYKIRIDAKSESIPAVKELFNRDAEATKIILEQLFKSGIARRELFVENLTILDADASYTNILRHDKQVLELERVVKTITDEIPLNQFLKKLSIYFAEENGLVIKLLEILKERLENQPDVKLARPLAILTGEDFKSLLQNLDELKDGLTKRVAAALRANAHYVRPKINMDELDNINMGAKALSTIFITSRTTDVDRHVNKLLTGRRTVKSALMLAQRSANESSAFSVSAKLRPVAVLKSAMAYFRRNRENSNLSVWETVRPILLNVDLKTEERQRKNLQQRLMCAPSMPQSIRAEYCVILYKKLSEVSQRNAIYALHRDLEILIPDIVNVETVEEILLKMLSTNEEDPKSILYPNIFMQHLLLCKSEEEQTRRFQTIGRPFLKRVEKIYEDPQIVIPFSRYLNRILKCLKYNRVFFDTQYVSCLPLIDKIEAWMQTVFRIEKHFVKFVEIRLTALFFEAVKYSAEKNPEIFLDLKKVKDEGVDIVAKEFGKNIARAHKEYTTKYFDSITEFFKEAFLRYFDGYFPDGPSKSHFVSAVNKAILKANIGKEARLVSFYVKNRADCTNDCEILKSVLASKDTETKFFFHADQSNDY